jgi:hypothetical protein
VIPPRAICCWTFCWYTHVAPDEPYGDLHAAAEETRARGFDTLRLCAMPSYVSRALRTGRELRLAEFSRGPSRNLRWYDFRGGVSVDPPRRLLDLFRAARAVGLRIVVSNWDFQQAFKFEAEPDLRNELDALPDVDAMFRHVERTLCDTLGLLEEHDLLDVVAAVEIMNEFEGAEVGPLPRLAAGTADASGPFVATAGYQHTVRTATRGLVERTIDGLRADFPSLPFTVSTTWPWTDPAPPVNRDVLSVNMYLTNRPVFARYFELFEDGDAWFGRIRDDAAAPILREGAPRYADWLAENEGWRDLYYPQCYLGLYLDPERHLDFLTAEFEAHEAEVRRATLDLLDEAAAQGEAWYLGEGYANSPPTTSLWNQSVQSLAFHRWVIDEALRRGACGLTPTTMAAPEHPDVWAEKEWLQAANETIGKEVDRTRSSDWVAS